VARPHHPLVVSLVVLLLGAALLIVYDIWVGITSGTESTISWHLWQASREHPIIPALMGFVVGLLFGHFFWQMQS
jgi:hypothetical protein